MTGRPTLLTPEIQAKIVDRVRRGNYPSVAAGSCGIGRSTFFRWMAQGEAEPDSAYRDFRDAVKDAADEAESAMVDVIRLASVDSWQAAAWWLERTRHQRYARRLHEQDKAAVAASVADQFKAARQRGRKA